MTGTYWVFFSGETRVEGGESNSLIQMSVVDSARGVRRSSVVVIEHVCEAPSPSQAEVEEDQGVYQIGQSF